MRALAGECAQADAGVVVQAVDDPGLFAALQRHLRGVDLPEVVGALALEALARLALPWWLRRDQVVAPERAVDGRNGGRCDPGASQLGMDAPRSPARVTPAQRANLDLEGGLDLSRRSARPP